MAVRTILKYPSAKLRIPTSRVIDFEAAKDLAVDLVDTMIVNFGLGLAANQININRSILVTKATSTPSIAPSIAFPECCVLINPEIELLSDNLFVWEEACLSVPNFRGRVSRHQEIQLRYQNLSGDSVSVNLSGLEALSLIHI